MKLIEIEHQSVVSNSKIFQGRKMKEMKKMFRTVILSFGHALS